jgi:hypothetical protein
MTDLSAAERRALERQLVAIAQDVLAERIGVIDGARQMMPLRPDLDPDNEDEDLLAITGIESQTDHLPLGAWRTQWSAEALRAKDEEIAENEAFFRDTMFRRCRSLVERYTRPV